MTDKQAAATQQQRPSTNKNIKKLRAISMVCSLTSSWQKWAADNEKKQASEPSGWTPSSLGGVTEEGRKQWFPKKNPQIQPQPEDGSRTHISSGEALTPVTLQKDKPKVLLKDEPKDVHNTAEASIGAAIKVKNVVKTVTSGVQEKSLGISLLTEKIRRDNLPSEEEIDRILKKKSSPTRRRKCSNMVSSLTKSWKQVENWPGGKGGGEPGERTSWVGSGECDMVETEETGGEEKASEDDAESEVTIKRSTVSM